MIGTHLSEGISSSAHAPERPVSDNSKIAYQLPQPVGMVPDAFVGSALDLDGDERDWVPQSKDVAFRPLILNVSQGYYINILRVRASGVHGAPPATYSVVWRHSASNRRMDRKSGHGSMRVGTGSPLSHS
jgi:hypothetical protein